MDAIFWEACEVLEKMNKIIFGWYGRLKNLYSLQQGTLEDLELFRNCCLMGCCK